MSESTISIPGWSEPNEALDIAAASLAAADGPADEAGTWPEALWHIVVEAGANRWALPASVGGPELDRRVLLERYARVAEGSLTAAFILSQHDAAVRRLAAAADRPNARGWLDAIATGDAFATVGISQLTTSRRRGAHALLARPGAHGGAGYRLEGIMPWVTAAERAQVLVTGAVLDGGEGRQMLLAVPTDRPGLSVRPAFPLAALQASCTAEVVCDGVEVAGSDLLAGPAHDVMTHPGATGTGGLETSALALGQARAALVALAGEAPRRTDLSEPVEALADAWQDVWSTLLAAATGSPSPPQGEGARRADEGASRQVRAQANALVLRITQAYLTARKGTGFLRTDPAQRWARQALFFLVWSCPGPVAQAAIRDLAGLCSG
jgi:alkylation response protein AidB-like acyl-CoA dehydrogenase